MTATAAKGRKLGGRLLADGRLAVSRARWAVAALALGALGVGMIACGGDGADSGASTPACGPGTTLKNGACAPACGAGTVFEPTSGSCVVSAGGSAGGGGAAGGGGSAMAGTSGGGIAGEGGGGTTSGGAGGAAGDGGGGGQPGGSGGAAGGGGASYCPSVIDLNCDPACGAVHPSCSTGYCVKVSSVDLSQMKDTYVLQLPTSPLTSHCCSGKERYILHYETAPGLTGMNYRMRFPAGNNGWVGGGTDTPSNYCLGLLPPATATCLLPKRPQWTFATDAVQIAPTTVIFEKTKAACPLVSKERTNAHLTCRTR